MAFARLETASEPASSSAEHESETSSLAPLIAGAKRGDQRCWNELIERFTPLVGQIARSFRLSHHDVQDVGQFVWLRLFEHLDKIREPLALPGWVSTVARNEALRVAKAGRRSDPMDPHDPGNHAKLGRQPAQIAPEDALLAAERQQLVRDGLAELTPEHGEFLVLLHSEVPYTEISRRLGMPTGSIGPTRARCLRKLRATAAMQTLLAAS